MQRKRDARVRGVGGNRVEGGFGLLAKNSEMMNHVPGRNEFVTAAPPFAAIKILLQLGAAMEPHLHPPGSLEHIQGAEDASIVSGSR